MDFTFDTSTIEQLRGVFVSVFYVGLSLMLILSACLEFFQMPLGKMPSFQPLLGRAFIALLLFAFYSEISNTIAAVFDSMTAAFGDTDKYFDNLKQIVQRGFFDGKLSLNVLLTIRFALVALSYTLLYLTVMICSSAVQFVYIIAYVFSPLLIVLYVHPATAVATHALFRSLIEAGFWKLIWTVLLVLLFSVGMADIKVDSGFWERQANVLELMAINVFFAGSVLLTPVFVNRLLGGGIASGFRTFGSLALSAIPGASLGAKLTKEAGKSAWNKGHDMASNALSRREGKIAKAGNSILSATPKFKTRNHSSLYWQSNERRKNEAPDKTHPGQSATLNKWEKRGRHKLLHHRMPDGRIQTVMRFVPGETDNKEDS